MFSFTSLSTDREKQLKLEQELDIKLKNCKCPAKVYDYLFQLRELNRVLTLQQIRSHFYDIPPLYKAQLKLTDKLQHIIETHTTEQLCDYGLDINISLIYETITKATPSPI